MKKTLAKNASYPTILVESMHGFQRPLASMRFPELTLRMATLDEILEQDAVPGVIGMIKGPRTMLDQPALEKLARTYPDLTIAYIGRHPQRILAPEIISSFAYNGNAHRHSIKTDHSRITLLPMTTSPLSAAVAAFVLAVTNMILTKQAEPLLQLTIPAGNTFEHRCGHTFTLAQQTHLPGLHQRRVAILGTGDIGMHVLQMFAQANATIIYSATSMKSVPNTKNIAFSPFLRAPLAAAGPIDVLTLHLPPNTFVSLKHVQQVNLFVHTASSHNIDEEELLQALLEERIQTAVVDVFSHEGKHFAGSINPQNGHLEQSRLNPFAHPLDSDASQARKRLVRQLIEAKRLLLTPHIAYCEEHAITQTLLMAICQILPSHRSNPFSSDNHITQYSKEGAYIYE